LTSCDLTSCKEVDAFVFRRNLDNDSQSHTDQTRHRSPGHADRCRAITDRMVADATGLMPLGKSAAFVFTDSLCHLEW